MKDYEVYNEDKSLKAVVINNILYRYVRPDTRYNCSDIVPVGKPIKATSHAKAKQQANAWCGIVTKH